MTNTLATDNFPSRVGSAPPDGLRKTRLAQRCRLASDSTAAMGAYLLWYEVLRGYGNLTLKVV